MSQSLGTETAPRQSSYLRSIGRNAIWVLLLLACTIFASASPYFLNPYNITEILLQAAIFGFLAIGLTPLMVNGNIDLSVGSTIGLTACLAIGLQTLGLAIALPATIACGAALGCLNGWLVEKAGINSFIVTLAAMIGIRGLAFLYTGEGSITSTSSAFSEIGTMSLGPFSLPVIVFAIIFVLFHWLLSRTIHGRNAYAIGGNRSAAVNAGVQVSTHVIINFTLCGATAALCGIVMASQLGAATPSYGSGYELWAITAVVLGGTSLRGGSGTLVGTLGGVLTLAVLRNGIDIVQIQPFYAQVIMGSILIAAIAVDKVFNQR